MDYTLSILSFIFAGLLFVLVPVQLRNVALGATNVPVISLIAWLILCNVLQGVNALRSVPAWCELSTQILLCISMAASGACVCLCRHLELVSSIRDVPFGTKPKRKRTLIELCFCILLPLLYSAAHFIVQTQRFQVVPEFGCQTSMHNSIPALFIVYFPPLVMCSIGFVYFGLAVSNITAQRVSFTHHLESRSRIIAASFVRLIATSAVQTTFVAAVAVYSVYVHIASGLVVWKSFASVYSEVGEILVVKSAAITREEWARISVAWWTVPVLSIVTLASAGCGVLFENDRVLSWWNGRTRMTPVLPTTSRPRIQTLELKSGWDDSLRSRRSFLRGTTRTPSPKNYPPSPKYITRSNSPEHTDDVFAASTLSYLQSPVAQTLGLTVESPISPPPPMYYSPSMRQQQQLKPQSFPAEDTTSTTSTIFGSQWPEPPRTIPAHPSLRSSPSPSLTARDPSRTGDHGHEYGETVYMSVFKETRTTQRN